MANNKNKANKAKVETKVETPVIDEEVKEDVETKVDEEVTKDEEETKVESNNTKTDLIEKVMDEVKSVKEKSKNAYQKAIGSLIIVRH